MGLLKKVDGFALDPLSGVYLIGAFSVYGFCNFCLSWVFGPVLLSYAFYSLTAISLVTVYRRYVDQFGEPLKVQYDKKNPFINRVVNKCKCLTTELYTPPLIGLIDTTGTFFTILGAFVKMHRFPPVNYVREMHTCKDGGTIGLDWVEPKSGDPKKNSPILDSEYNANSTDPIVIIQHGNNGGSKISFVLHIAWRIQRETNWRVVVMLCRGCSGVELTTPQVYNTVHITDFIETVDKVRKRYPKAPLYAMGWSLGATIVGRFIGETGKKCELNGAILVSPTWDFLLDKKKPTIWFDVWAEMALAPALKDNVRKNKQKLEELGKDGVVDLDHVLKSKNVKEFDIRCQVPRSPYKSVDEYYKYASPALYSENITVPTLSINAQDDPISYIEAVHDTKAGPGLVFAMPTTGGHCAMIEFGSKMNNSKYMQSYPDRAIMEWISVLEEERMAGCDWRSKR
mmetsp:Transcript_41554/g.50382  ORF Transcript_41554/g.50382 Transcript_41554/m.50382 type:complete len:455 (-) Transcript_41554:529-1893(-)|eukprot:CAMPEP_0197850174 /NCGR_PEP_ID=MMETSP1438-20131217/14503_1 /TAXON_ID=1461541 /ORGANISM="Pterosperma sp., Strain CCMP1384" /LENGTH=454 /DNA_ID=CAMNT_0043463183 /DNA_START=211 /DNA_END=1575 /DNA_ORIENTATION=+